MNMSSCQKLWCLTTIVMCAFFISRATGIPTAEAEAEAEPRNINDGRLLVITEDIIPDIENSTHKVIRVNPLDLPIAVPDPSGNMDSSLFTIQTLVPHQHPYVNSNRMRKSRPRQHNKIEQDSPIIRNLSQPKPHKPKHQQKKKHLHFLYNQENLEGKTVSRTMPVRVAPGAYPVYYVISRTNGKFGKYPLKSFRTPKEFMKYVVKSKLEPIDWAERVEE